MYGGRRILTRLAGEKFTQNPVGRDTSLRKEGRNQLKGGLKASWEGMEISHLLSI